MVTVALLLLSVVCLREVDLLHRSTSEPLRRQAPGIMHDILDGHHRQAEHIYSLRVHTT